MGRGSFWGKTLPLTEILETRALELRRRNACLSLRQEASWLHVRSLKDGERVEEHFRQTNRMDGIRFAFYQSGSEDALGSVLTVTTRSDIESYVAAFGVLDIDEGVTLYADEIIALQRFMREISAI